MLFCVGVGSRIVCSSHHPDPTPANSVGAAVAILESHAPGAVDPVRGLARLVQVAPKMTIIDLTVRGLLPGTYDATVRVAGDISRGVASTGGVWEGEKGRLGTVEVGTLGAGSVLVDRPIEVWELIGRSIAVEKRGEKGETIVGVIARSAGVWENEKTVG